VNENMVRRKMNVRSVRCETNREDTTKENYKL